MRFLGIDYGTVRIGLALSDPTGTIASPAGVIEVSSQKDLVRQVSELCRKEKVSKIIMGLPKHMNGDEGESAKKARALGGVLKEHTNLPVIFQDERLSTAAVQRSMIEADLSRKKRKENIDASAAALILQGYLDLCASNEDIQ